MLLLSFRSETFKTCLKFPVFLFSYLCLGLFLTYQLCAGILGEACKMHRVLYGLLKIPSCCFEDLTSRTYVHSQCWCLSYLCILKVMFESDVCISGTKQKPEVLGATDSWDTISVDAQL